METRHCDITIHSRSWSSWVTFAAGSLILVVGIIVFIVKSKLFGSFPILLSLVIIYGAVNSLIKDYTWNLKITDTQIIWQDSRNETRNSILISQIRGACFETGDNNCLRIETKSGKEIIIPNHYYKDKKKIQSVLKNISNEIDFTE